MREILVALLEHYKEIPGAANDLGRLVLTSAGLSPERSIVFVMPQGSDEVSGGNLYNAGLLRALEEQGPLRVVQAAQWAGEPASAGIVLVDTLNLEEFLSVVGRRAPGQRFVLIVHHLPSLEPGLDPSDVKRDLERKALPLFDGFVTTGAFACDWLKTRLPAARVINIEPPIATLAPARAFEIGQPIRALMVANLIERKGVLPFLEALAKESIPADLQLDIVGRLDLDPPYAQRCQALVQRSPSLAKGVWLRGSLAHESVATWYQQASLFLSASTMETFGISLQEARHHGLAILAVRGGNVASHLRDGHTGELLDSPSMLARRLVALTERPAALRAYSSAALQERPVATHTWSDAAAKLLCDLGVWFPDAG